MTTITKLRNALAALERTKDLMVIKGGGMYEQVFEAIADLKAVIAEMEAGEPKDEHDLLPHDALFVDGQMGAHVTRVTAQPKAEPALCPKCSVDYLLEPVQPKAEPVQCLDCGSNNVGVPANYDSLVDSVKTKGQDPESFEQWNAKQHADPEEIGFLQALRIAYCCGQDSVLKVAAPQAKQLPLLDAEIWNWWASENGMEDCDMTKYADFKHVVRAIESKHGIRGEK